MPFATYETSTYGGQPIQLYEFYRESAGADIYWHYNTSDRAIDYAFNRYLATAISNDGIRLNGEAASSEMKVTLPITTQFCLDYRLGGSVPSDTVYLRLFIGHQGDIDSNNLLNDARLYWIGTVDGLAQKDDITAELTCTMLPASFQRSGLRYGYLPNCPHMLYEPLTCRVDKTLYALNSTVTAVQGNTITATDFGAMGNKWFDGGYIEYTLDNGVTERRLISTQSGEILKLLGIPPGLEVGMAIIGYAGCAHTIAACQDKFNNFPNFGGFTNMPGRSPFDGLPVF